jgi:hypothetical protein
VISGYIARANLKYFFTLLCTATAQKRLPSKTLDFEQDFCSPIRGSIWPFLCDKARWEERRRGGAAVAAGMVDGGDLKFRSYII